MIQLPLDCLIGKERNLNKSDFEDLGELGVLFGENSPMKLEITAPKPPQQCSNDRIWSNDDVITVITLSRYTLPSAKDHTRKDYFKDTGSCRTFFWVVPVPRNAPHEALVQDPRT